MMTRWWVGRWKQVDSSAMFFVERVIMICLLEVVLYVWRCFEELNSRLEQRCGRESTPSLWTFIMNHHSRHVAQPVPDLSCASFRQHQRRLRSVRRMMRGCGLAKLGQVGIRATEQPTWPGRRVTTHRTLRSEHGCVYRVRWMKTGLIRCITCLWLVR